MATKDASGNLHSENNGQFVSKEEQDAKREQAERIYNSEPTTVSENQNKNSSNDFFGEEFKNLKGKDAVDKLLKEKRGHVKNAFFREEVGGIDLVWGNEKGGLCHTIQKRDALLQKGKGKISGIEMVRKIPEILQKGEFSQDNKGRFNIEYGEYRVGILPTYYDKKINWVVTAMELWK